MHLSSWKFPGNEASSIGTVSGIGKNLELKNQPAQREYRSKLSKISARTNFDHRFFRNDFDGAIKNMIRNLNASQFSFIPQDLLSGLLFESLAMERNLLKRDIGPLLKYHNGSLIYPIFNNATLCKSPVDLSDSLLLQLKTPARQLVCGTDLLYAVTFGSVEIISKEFSSLVSLDIQAPRHVASHQVFQDSCAIIGQQVQLWDIESGTSSLNIEESYSACEFGSHPCQLLLNTDDHIDCFDIRSSKSTTLYETKNIHSFKPNPSSLFNIIIATDESTLVLDTRYLKAPLLEWKLNSSYESCIQIDFLQDKFYTFGRQGEILLYQVVGSPPRGYYPRLYPSFHYHDSNKYYNPNSIPYDYIQDHTHQQKLIEYRDLAPWPPLVGCQFVQSNTTSFSIYQLVQDGSMFKQTISSTPEINETNDNEIESIQKTIAQTKVSIEILRQNSILPTLDHQHLDLEIPNPKQWNSTINETLLSTPIGDYNLDDSTIDLVNDWEYKPKEQQTLEFKVPIEKTDFFQSQPVPGKFGQTKKKRRRGF